MTVSRSRPRRPTTARRWCRRSRRSKPTSRWRRTCPRTSSRSAAAPPRSGTTCGSSCAPNDPGYVYFLETRGRGVVPARLADRRLVDDPRDAARSHGRDRPDVGDADRGRLVRLRARAASACRRATEVRLDSEFDYARQAILYLPKSMPDPRQPSFVAAAAREIVGDPQAHRRTRVRAVHQLRQPARGAPARVDRSSSTRSSSRARRRARRCCATSRRRRNAVLLATSSFWQGVDVVGEALSCVIIDKLPFASPGDPITAARIEAITARGGSRSASTRFRWRSSRSSRGWAGCSATARTAACWRSSIRGCKTMGYGRRFLASLPPAPVTQDLADVDRFFDADDGD